MRGAVVGAEYVYVGEADIHGQPHDRRTGAAHRTPMGRCRVVVTVAQNGLLGLGRSKDDETGAEGNNPADSKELGSNAQDKMSLMLVNVLSWLRLPAGSREGISLKGLLGHQYFAPLRHTDIESEIPSAWRTFMDQGKEV
ncbi:unnamed protein product [Ectocarpus sp. CCAP 1310/34]|nr:unnamed protein product [Ectocarpus sp. CCAP 1310/34]